MTSRLGESLCILSSYYFLPYHPIQPLRACICFLSALCYAELISRTSVNPFQCFLYIQSHNLNLIGVCRLCTDLEHNLGHIMEKGMRFRNKILRVYLDIKMIKMAMPSSLVVFE